MSISTYGDLKAAVATYLNRANLTDRIPEFIASAEQYIAYGCMMQGLESDPLRIRAMETSVDLSITGQTVALPTRYLQSRRLYINTNPVTICTYVVPDQFWRTGVSSDSATPTEFTIEGENIVFGPIPDSNYTGKFLYYEQFAALSGTNDTNWLLTNAPNVYLDGALMEAFRYARNPQDASLRHAAFAGRINALNNADKSDRYSGSPWEARTDTGNP